MFIENLDPTDRETISHPTIETPIVEHFIRHEQRQVELRGTNRMFDLKTVSVSIRSKSRVPYAPLKLISIAQPEFLQVEPKSDRNRETIFPDSSARKRLHADVQVVGRNRQILTSPESESEADTFVYRMTDIASQSQRAQHIEIKFAGDRDRELNVGPELIVSAVQHLRRSTNAKQQEQNKTCVSE